MNLYPQYYREGMKFFHSTILKDNFKLNFDSSHMVAPSSNILNCYMEIFDRAFKFLMKCDCIDSYGRVKSSIVETVDILVSTYKIDVNTMVKNLDMEGDLYFIFKLLKTVMITQGALNLDESFNLYPQSFLAIPLFKIAQSILNDSRVIIPSVYDHVEIEIPLILLRSDRPTGAINYDVSLKRNCLLISMVNGYGNKVTMEIQGNTNASDEIFEKLAKQENLYLDDLAIAIGWDRALESSNKLLFSLYYSQYII